MGEFDKEYEAFRIFEEILEQSQVPPKEPSPRPGNVKPVPAEAPYYEIEYDSCPMPGVGKFVLKPTKIQAPEKDEIRDIFNQMRDIAREYRTSYFNGSRFYDKASRQENSKIFYKQGMFMKDFKDEYDKAVPYSSYYPSYQMMGYDQLRTYFTWRTKVRQGEVAQASLSYAFLYVYELLNNIGVDGPEDGLEKLMFFWAAFRGYDGTIDKYMLQWVKDYHIYYELPWSFQEFLEKNCLEAHYPELSGPEDNFDLYCTISKYDIRKSAFYSDDKMGQGHPMQQKCPMEQEQSMEQGKSMEQEKSMGKARSRDFIKECFDFVMDRLKETFSESRISLEEYIFQPTKNMTVWTPFKGALFYQAIRQPDRRVVLSEKEIYICSGNRWTFNTVITTESGKKFIGYCMKQMEATLRKAEKYKYKLSASTDMLSPVMADELQKAGISLEKIVTEATLEFYREANKTVVNVDPGVLERIREEALATQEKLIVPQQEEFWFTAPVSASAETGQGCSRGQENAGTQAGSAEWVNAEAQVSSIGAVNSAQDSWEGLKAALTETEQEALLTMLNGEINIKRFADSHGIMLEVLIDGINEKAMDFIGDSLLDGEFLIYDDYVEQVKGMVEKG